MREDYTHIGFVIDNSGSMSRIQYEMNKGIKSLIEEQRMVPGKCSLSVVTFDSIVNLLMESRNVHDINPTSLYINPQGYTALYDAMGAMINNLGLKLAQMPESERPSKVLIIVITDGLENASRKFNQKQIAEMVQHQRDVYKWQFLFLGADQDSILTAKEMGFDLSSVYNFSAVPDKVNDVWTSTSKGITSYRSQSKSIVSNVLNVSTNEFVEKGTK